VRDHAHAHQRVRGAAELGALAEVHARLLGGEHQVVHAVGDQVALAAHLGDPEGVQHVVGEEHQVHGAPHGHVHLVGGDDGVAVGLRVAELPPPLLADHLDGHGVGGSVLGSGCVAKIAFTVGMAITARITAGISVHATSRRVLPWICLGSPAPGW
jgi:hypothetical protein